MLVPASSSAPLVMEEAVARMNALLTKPTPNSAAEGVRRKESDGKGTDGGSGGSKGEVKGEAKDETKKRDDDDDDFKPQKKRFRHPTSANTVSEYLS